MKIISIVLVSIALFFTMQVSAQKALNLELGVNVDQNYLNAKNVKPFSNYNFGISWDIPVNEMLYVRIGGGFAQDSKRTEDSYSWGKATKIATISNFDLPVTVGYRKELGKIGINAQAGLFWSRHLAGNLYARILDCNSLAYFETKRNENIWFGNDKTDWKKQDVGFLVKAGAEFKNFELGVSFAMGILEQINASDVIYRPMEVWPNTVSHEAYDYGFTPEVVKRLTITLAYRFDLSDSEAKAGE